MKNLFEYEKDLRWWEIHSCDIKEMNDMSKSPLVSLTRKLGHRCRKIDVKIKKNLFKKKIIFIRVFIALFNFNSKKIFLIYTFWFFYEFLSHLKIQIFLSDFKRYNFPNNIFKFSIPHKYGHNFRTHPYPKRLNFDDILKIIFSSLNHFKFFFSNPHLLRPQWDKICSFHHATSIIGKVFNDKKRFLLKLRKSMVRKFLFLMEFSSLAQDQYFKRKEQRRTTAVCQKMRKFFFLFIFQC